MPDTTRLEGELEAFVSSQWRDDAAAYNTLRMRLGAVKQLLPMLHRDDPPTARFVYENIDLLHARWREKNPNPSEGTADAYLSRAKKLLQAFLAKDQMPLPFLDEEAASDLDPALTSKRFRELVQSLREGPKAAVTLARLNELIAIARHEAPGNKNRIIPLDGVGSEFRFSLHLTGRGLTMADIAKVNANLLSLASDFEVSDMTTIMAAFQQVLDRKKKGS
jgi:hypothetical protein